MAVDAHTYQEVTVIHVSDGKHRQGYGPAQNLRDMHNGLPRLLQLYPYNNNVRDTSIDIVAVHGIETCSPKTWISYERDIEPRGRKVHWLLDEDMLPPQIPQARIWAYDYNSNCYSDNAQQVDILGLGGIFLRVLYEARSKGVGSRTLLFIGSCFGGVVIAQGLEKASRDPRYTDILRSTAGVVFLGTPLRGTRLASIAEWIALLRELMHRETSETLLQGLRENANSLDNMVYNFAMMTIENNLQIRCFYETRKTQVANFASRTIAKAFGIPKVEFVPRESACLDCHPRFALDVRHAMMNKFRGPEDVNFKLIADSLKEIADNARLTRARTATEMRCLECLASNYRDDKTRNKQRVPGTCEWFLTNQKFKDWRQKEGDGLLWVSADPGCGKSVLSRALVDEGLLSNNTRTATICYFFFKDDDIRRQTEASALCAVLHQLFTQKPALLKHGMSRFENLGEKFSVSVSDLWDTFKNAAADPGAGDIVCVLDALDECKQESARNITSQLGRLCTNRNVGKTAVKFLVTSRPYSYIGTYFNGEIEDMTSISLKGEEESEKISREIDLVIRHEVPKLAKAREPPLTLQVQDNLIERLTTISHRTYLWLHLILEEIREGLSSTSTGLRKIVSSMPRSIEEAYEKILIRVEKRGFASQARRLLHVVLGAERPLTLAEMNIAMAIDGEILESGCCETYEALSLEPENAFRIWVRNLCGLFVSIVESKIYLIHQTAKNFLVQTQSNNLPHPNAWKHSFEPAESNMMILEICISYILIKELELEQLISARNMKYPWIERTKDWDLIDEEARKDLLIPFKARIPIYSFLEYAAEYWSLHFQKAKSSLDRSMMQSVLQVCDTRTVHFKNWYHSHPTITGEVGEPLTDLAVAAFLGLDTIVKLLLEQEGTDLNFKCGLDYTPLSLATAEGHVEVVRLLLAQKSVDLNLKNKWDQTALHLAVVAGYSEIVRLLLTQKGIDLNSRDDHNATPLWLAVWKGHVEIVRLLLAQEGIDLNPRDEYNETPLCWAAREGHVEIVRLLLAQEGIDLNSEDRHGRTLLCNAVTGWHVDVVRLLLERDDVEKNNSDGDDTPLLHAVRMNHPEIIKLLLENKDVDPNAWCCGWNPLNVAIRAGNPLIVAIRAENEELVKLLLANDRIKPLYGDSKRTPIHYATIGRKIKILALLLEANGVNLLMVSFTSKTPLWVVYDPCGMVEFLFLEKVMEELIFGERYLELERNIVGSGDPPSLTEEEEKCLGILQILLERTSFEKVFSGDGYLLLMKRRCNMFVGPSMALMLT